MAVYDLDFPDGVTPSDFKSHPLRLLLRDVSFHGPRAMPSTTELRALGVDDATIARLRAACESVADVHETGHHKDAWDLADREALAIIAPLDTEQRSPRFFKKPDPLADVDEPHELARRVPSMYRNELLPPEEA